MTIHAQSGQTLGATVTDVTAENPKLHRPLAYRLLSKAKVKLRFKPWPIG